MRLLVRRPSPALVVACGALLLSLTGTGLADVAQLGRNTVGTPQLRTGAVTTPKIRNGAVATAKLRNRAVTLAKLAPNARIAGPAGPTGPTGPAGPQGPPGGPANIADGSISSAKLAANAVTASKIALVVRFSQVDVPNGQGVALTRACLAGERLVGGGALWGGQFSHAQAQGTHLVLSTPNGQAWLGRGYNGSGGSRAFEVRAICVAATS
jgi:hypothetical protein